MKIDTCDRLKQPATWRGQWLGYLVLAVLVFFTWLPSSYYLMVAYPWIAIWQLGFLALGIWTVWMLRQFKIPFRPLGYGLDWIVGFGVFVLILSGIFARFKEVAAWNISLALCYVILLYVLRNWVGNTGLTINRLWNGVCISGVISCVIGLIVWYPEFVAGRPRIQYPIGHPNFVAGYINLVLPLTVALAMSNKGWKRIGGFAACALMTLVLYHTGSRGGFLGILVLAIVAAGFFIVRSRGKQRWFSIVGCIVGLGIVAVIALNNPRVRQIVSIGNTDGQVVQLRVDGQTKDRLLMLQAAANIFKDRPLFGVGVGNMSRVYNLYRPIETGTGATNVQQLHNTPVQILGELGIAGLAIYLWFIGWWGYLWFRVYGKLSQFRDRYLLYGIGSGFLAYGVSSLTDYQLENISLSSVIVILVVFLIQLADSCSFTYKGFLNSYSRRWLSLGIITVLTLILLLWLPVTWAMKLTVSAENKFQQGKIDRGYEQLSLAARLVPWDVTYNLLAGFKTLKIRDNIDSNKDPQLYKELTELSLKHFQQVVKAAPNDAPFNQMLGMLYRDIENHDAAILHFRRAIQLQPRNGSYSYYLLGREYLLQNQIDKAITALALQGVIEPRFLMSDIWSEPIFKRVKDRVFQKTLNLFSSLLEQLPVNSSSYNSIYEKYTLLRWWDKQPLDNLEEKRLRPIVRALILAESQPESALEIIETQIKTSSNPAPFLLLGSWLKPQQYLAAYLNTEAGSKLEKIHIEKLKATTGRNLAFRNWLGILKEKTQSSQRPALELAYRNYYIGQVSDVKLPEIITYSNFRLLNLFTDYHREVPVLDSMLDRVNTEQLNIPQATTNQFTLVN